MSLDTARDTITGERGLAEIGEFHVRWYKHRGAKTVGPFRTQDELTSYMTRHRLGRPDELLTAL